MAKHKKTEVAPPLPALNTTQKDIATSLITDAVEAIFSYFPDKKNGRATAITHVCFAIDGATSAEQFRNHINAIIESEDAKKEDKRFFYNDFNKTLERLYGWTHSDKDAFSLLRLEQCGDVSYLEHFVPEDTLAHWKSSDRPLKDWNFSFSQESDIVPLQEAKEQLINHWSTALADIATECIKNHLKEYSYKTIKRADKLAEDSPFKDSTRPDPPPRSFTRHLSDERLTSNHKGSSEHSL